MTTLSLLDVLVLVGTTREQTRGTQSFGVSLVILVEELSYVRRDDNNSDPPSYDIRDIPPKIKGCFTPRPKLREELSRYWQLGIEGWGTKSGEPP